MASPEVKRLVDRLAYRIVRPIRTVDDIEKLRKILASIGKEIGPPREIRLYQDKERERQAKEAGKPTTVRYIGKAQLLRIYPRVVRAAYAEPDIQRRRDPTTGKPKVVAIVLVTAATIFGLYTSFDVCSFDRPIVRHAMKKGLNAYHVAIGTAWTGAIVRLLKTVWGIGLPVLSEQAIRDDEAYQLPLLGFNTC